MSLVEKLIIGNYENNIIPLTYIDYCIQAISEFIHHPAGELKF